jgi:hypothetical protein
MPRSEVAEHVVVMLIPDQPVALEKKGPQHRMCREPG